MARLELPDGDGDEIIRAFSMAPALAAGAGTFSAAVYGRSSLPLRLRELARMRIAQINDCGI
jgi:alkylhydroperoxidase family enzyme